MASLATPLATDGSSNGPVARALRFGGLILSALADGLSARDRYDVLRARGIPHALAAAEAFYVTSKR